MGKETHAVLPKNIPPDQQAVTRTGGQSHAANMKQHKLSLQKRVAKPILFGTLITALATAFYYRHRFFADVEDIRAQEKAHYDAKLLEVLERRHKQKEELEQKRKSEDR